MLAAVAAATPYLFFERRDLWDRLAARILGGRRRGDRGARARARARDALASRHGPSPRSSGRSARCARWRAPRRSDTLDEARRWIEVIAVTDAVDGAERDPLDLELGLENLMRARGAVRRRGGRRARGAVRRRRSRPTFHEARRIALGSGRLRQRAAAINALEGCARAFALRLWGPLLATRPRRRAHRGAGPRGDLEDARPRAGGDPRPRQGAARASRAPRPRGGPRRSRCSRSGSAATRSTPAARTAGSVPAAGPTAHDTCLWLRKLEGLADGSRELPPSLEGALSDAVLAPRRHHARHRARRGRRRALARAVRRVVGARHRSARRCSCKLATALPMMAHERARSRAASRPRRSAPPSRPRADGEWGADAQRGARGAARRGHRARARARGARPRRSRRLRRRVRATSRTSRRCASSWCSPASGSTARSPTR